MTDLKRLREKLAKISADMRNMHSTAEEEDRGFTPEERDQWDAYLSEYEDTEARIKRAEQMSRLEGRGIPAVPDYDAATDPTAEQVEERADMTPIEHRGSDEYRNAYEHFLRGDRPLTNEERGLLAGNSVDMEMRAQGIGTDAGGGFTVPEDFAGFITETMQDFSGLLGAAAPTGAGPTLLRTARGNNLPFPTNDDTGNAGVILAENTQVAEQDTVFGERTLGSYMYSSRLIRVSLQLLQDEAVSLQAYLGNILGKRLGRAMSPHFAAGSGSGQPTGLSTAATDGNVNISAGAGISFDNLLDFEHALDPAYRRRGAQWVFNDNTLRLIKGIVDGNSRPLWLPGDTGSLADNAAGPTINGYGYIVDQGMPDLAAAARPICFGDLSEFYIREVLGVNLFRFNERYMDFLQIGWMGYARYDSNLIDTAAVVTDVAVA